nr:MAG TPA: hypothetical protein [Caudoviricetes sp.]
MVISFFTFRISISVSNNWRIEYIHIFSCFRILPSK